MLDEHRPLAASLSLTRRHHDYLSPSPLYVWLVQRFVLRVSRLASRSVRIIVIHSLPTLTSKRRRTHSIENTMKNALINLF